MSTNGRVWKLARFAECVGRWENDFNPAPDCVAEVLMWLLDVLRHDPFQASAAPAGDSQPVTTWFARLPVWLPNGNRVVCLYDIDAENHTLVCYTIADLREPI